MAILTIRRVVKKLPHFQDFATYNEEYATTKTDIWEFGIFIFQIILLNDNQLSVGSFDKLTNYLINFLI